MEVLRKTAEFRIKKQTEGLLDVEVTRLSLSAVPLLPNLLSPYVSLVHLILCDMKPKLKDLLEIPLAGFPLLAALEVSDNAIVVSVGAEPGFVLKSLRHLLMPNNKVSRWEEIDTLHAWFPELEILDLDNNPLFTDPPEDARSRVFDAFKNLRALNAQDRDGNEVTILDSDESESEAYDTDDDEEGDEEDYSETTDSDYSDEDNEDEEDEEGEDDNDDSDNGSGDGDEPPAKRQRRTE